MIRSKENLVAIRPHEDVLTMETLLFGDEVVSPEDLGELDGVDEAKATKKEVDMARAADRLAVDGVRPVASTATSTARRCST